MPPFFSQSAKSLEMGADVWLNGKKIIGEGPEQLLPYTCANFDYAAEYLRQNIPQTKTYAPEVACPRSVLKQAVAQLKAAAETL